MRFDRRKTYPEPDEFSKYQALRAIIPRRVGGVIKQPGNPKVMLPLNVAVGKMRDATQWYIPAIKFNKGGYSEQAGSRKGDFQGDDSVEILPTTFVIVLSGGEVRIPTLNTGTYDFVVHWGDGASDTITAWDQPELVHVYDIEADYIVAIDGVFENIGYSSAENSPYKPTIIAILQWGSCSISGAWSGVFISCTDFIGVFAEDAPDLSACTQISGFAQSCTPLTTLNVSAWIIPPTVTVIANFCTNSPLIEELDLNAWDVSNCITLSNIIQSQAPDTPVKIDQWTPTSANVTVITNNKLATSDYDAILNQNTGWPSRVPYNTAVNAIFGATTTYTAGGDAEAGRSILTSNPYLWSITDGGPV